MFLSRVRAALDYTRKMRPEAGIRVHWRRRYTEDAVHGAEFVDLCRAAESIGIESIHVPIGGSLSDALELATTAGRETAFLRFRIGWNLREVLASLRGRELKHACDVLGGRLNVHMCFADSEADGDFQAAGEFIDNCRALFSDSDRPQFDIEGETAEAAFVAIQHGDCLWRVPDRPKQVYADALPVLHFGKEVGLATWVIAGETHEEALNAAAILLPGEQLDASHWICSVLWSGTASGTKTAALVGSFGEVARAIYQFETHGISQFLIAEWPGSRQMRCFGARILPLVRGLESAQTPG